MTASRNRDDIAPVAANLSGGLYPFGEFGHQIGQTVAPDRLFLHLAGNHVAAVKSAEMYEDLFLTVYEDKPRIVLIGQAVIDLGGDTRQRKQTMCAIKIGKFLVAPALRQIRRNGSGCRFRCKAGFSGALGTALKV